MKAIKIFNVNDVDVESTTKLVNNILDMMDNDYEQQLILNDVATNRNSLFILTNSVTDQLYFDVNPDLFAANAVDAYTAEAKYVLQDKDKYETAYDRFYNGELANRLEKLEDVDSLYAYTKGNLDAIAAGITYSEYRRLYEWFAKHHDNVRADELEEYCKTFMLFVNKDDGTVSDKAQKPAKNWIKISRWASRVSDDHHDLALLSYAVSQFDNLDDKQKLIKSVVEMFEEYRFTSLLSLEDNQFYLVNDNKALTDEEYKKQTIKKLIADWEKSGRKGFLCDLLEETSENLLIHVDDNSFLSIKRKEEQNTARGHYRYNNPFKKGTDVYELYESYLLAYARAYDRNESIYDTFHDQLNDFLLWRLCNKQLTYDETARWMLKHGNYDDDAIEDFLIEAERYGKFFDIKQFNKALAAAKRNK